MKIPMLDLHPMLQNCKIVAAVGEASGSNCSGKLKIEIGDFNGSESSEILTKNVNNLNTTMQYIVFEDTPNTGKVHPVSATLTLETEEQESVDDDKIIKLRP